MTRFAAALAAAVLALAVPAAPAGAAQDGDPALAVSDTTLPADRVSTVTITGTGYLVPPHAPGTEVFGGVYLFFGWVADPDRFGPSIRNSSDNDGTFGVTYAYPGGGGDAGTRDDGSGTMRLISFTAGGESGATTDFHMDEDGNWSTTLRIFGATFTSAGTDGESRTYDCQDVQCGVFTIGAHGKASATNEVFTPLTFTGTPPAGGVPGGDSGTSGDPAAPPDPAEGQPGEAAPDPSAAPTATPDAADPDAAGDIAPGGGGDDPLDVTATSARSTGGDPVPLLVVAALVTTLAGAFWWWRRRRARAGP